MVSTRGVLSHGGLRKGNLESPVFTGFYLPPGIAGLRSTFHALLHRCRQRNSLRVVALGQRLRRFVDHLTATVGEEHGERVRNWFQEKLCREKRQGGM